MRINFNATVDEMEQSAGSCESQAKNAGSREAAVFLMGAAAGIDLLASCKKPELFGSLVEGVIERYLARIGGDAA